MRLAKPSNGRCRSTLVLTKRDAMPPAWAWVASLLYLNRLDEALACFGQCSDALEGPAAFGKAVALQLLHRFGEAGKRL